MENVALINITLLSVLLIIYHHIIYPLILLALHKRLQKKELSFKKRVYKKSNSDNKFPSISIVIPAYNEQQWIAEKIRNLAALDYPSGRLKIIIICDGCSDDTDKIALQTIQEPECQHLSILIYPYLQNRGKVAVINTVMQEISSDLVALSDVSALISIDALLIASEHFKDPNIGVLNSHYQLLDADSTGEAAYWEYQCQLKTCEAALGSTLGAHGAFYMFRHCLFEPLAEDTINDDFILPMEIVAKGYRAEQDNRITALEMEQSSTAVDYQRRQRIAAGNLQQLLRLKQLLLPKYKGVSFTFISGKGLRVLMPFLMITALIGSFILALESILFILLSALQLAAYLLAIWHINSQPKNAHRYIKNLAYLVQGHAASLTGCLRYLLGLERGRWKPVKTSVSKSTIGERK